MPTQITFQDFQKRIKPSMLDDQGRFKGPNAGVNFMLEGMTPEQAYAAATHVRTYANDDVGLGPGGARELQAIVDQQLLDPAWRTGPNNGGGLIGGLGNMVQGMWDGFRTNPALMAAAGGAIASGMGVSGFTGGEAAGEFSGLSTAGTGYSPALDSAAAYDIGGGGLSVPNMASSTMIDVGAIPTTAAAPAATGGGLADGAVAVGGNADKAALLTGDGYGALASPAEMAAASGMPMNQLVAKYGPQIAKMAMAAVVSRAANDDKATGGGSSVNVDDLVSHAFGNTQSMENDYNTLFKPWAIGEVNKATARGDAGYDTIMGLASAPNKNLTNFQSYVDRVGSQGYRDQSRGQAMGEVQQQADIAQGSARRAAMARGVDPGKFALQANALGVNTAAAKTKAAADAEGLAWDQYGKAAQAASDMQLKDSNQRANLVTGANNLGGQGLNAGTKVATIDSAYRGGLTSGYNSTLGTVTGANSAANNQSNYEREHGLSGVINAGLATAATKWITDKGGDALGNLFSS